jgi:predicted PurR-regulated permease PerM
VKGAIPLGIASGLLNLLPFLGLIASLALPLAAALLQFNTPGPYIVITLKIMISFFVSKVNARRGESRFPSQLFCRSFDLP